MTHNVQYLLTPAVLAWHSIERDLAHEPDYRDCLLEDFERLLRHTGSTPLFDKCKLLKDAVLMAMEHYRKLLA